MNNEFNFCIIYMSYTNVDNETW